MPDPMADLEIEDVLSSIRRLVSEDLRGPDRHDRGVTLEKGAPANTNKLVLTESLRVPAAVEEAEPQGDKPEGDGPEGDEPDLSLRENVTGSGYFMSAAPVETADNDASSDGAHLWRSDAREDALQGSLVTPTASLEDTIAELEAAVAVIGEEFEPDGSEATEDEAPVGADFSDTFLVETEAEAGADDPDEDGDSAFPLDLAISGPPTEEGLAEPAEVADVFNAGFWHSARAGEVTLAAEAARIHFFDTDRAPEGDRPTEGLHDDAAGDVDDAATDTDPDVDPDAYAEGDTALPAMVERLTPRIFRWGAEYSSPVADAPAPTDEADEASESDEVREADEALAAGIGAPPEASEYQSDDDEGEAGIFDAPDEAVIDMDMLRDLVAEIIRQELQGTLGERITRNVRKLVRREINRALESRELD